MEIACPSCGKINSAAPCQRCGCDLEPLFAIRRAAQKSLETAARHLRDGAAPEALISAERSWNLRRSAEAARLAGLASIALRDFDGLLVWGNRDREPR